MNQKQNHAIVFIIATVVIDSMGIGIIIPVMPDLIRELSHTELSEAALWGGYLSFVYAFMQFLFSPTIGNISDRFGRRPVLLLSLSVLVIDYVIMGFAPSLWLLFVGRIIAGIAAATYSTASAFIADISAPKQRAQRFGLIGAGFGIGFILGPLIGGLVAEYGTRAPFFAAAALALINLCYGLWAMPESLTTEKRRAFSWRRANPLGAAKQILKLPMVAWFIVAMFLFSLAHNVYPAIWSFYCKQAFNWSNAQIGLSLAAVGIGFAIVQGGLIRVFLRKLGESNTVLLGLLFNLLALSGLAFAYQSWMVYALMPFSALGAVVSPALTGLMSQQVPDDAQGELQGALSSVTGMTFIIGPLLMTQLFGYFTGSDAPVYFPGVPFLAAAILTVMALMPFMIGLRRAV